MFIIKQADNLNSTNCSARSGACDNEIIVYYSHVGRLTRGVGVLEILTYAFRVGSILIDSYKASHLAES